VPRWAGVSETLPGEVVKCLSPDAIGFEFEASLFVETARNGYCIGEVSVHYRRQLSHTKLGSIRYWFGMGQTVTRERLSVKGKATCRRRSQAEKVI